MTVVFLKSFVMAGALAGAALCTPALAAETGGDLFAQNCSACHQAKGEGVAGAFPALAGNAFVQGDPKGPAYVVTHGRGGMPNFSGDLDDTQVAAILSYVRSSWGNKAGPLDPTLVASVRGSQDAPPMQTGLPAH
jgi:mono/diheme cytochrome c family protein